MRLGLMLGYSSKKAEVPLELVKEADRLGVYAIWTAEAYGSDCVVPLAWLGALTENIRLGTAIMQMPARTPAMTAMTAMTLDQLSNGRFLLGLGLSGPQVVEGWHGEAYGKPLGKTREYVEIVKKIFARNEPLVYDGEYYQIPYQGEDATGLGKPLKSILHGRTDMPIYLASNGPKNVTLTAEIADGWLPALFSPKHYDEMYRESIEAGFQIAGNGKSYDTFDIAPSVSVAMGDDLEICRNMVRPFLALYIGGMGAKGKNFYNDLARRMGYEAAADQIQELFLSGNKAGAMMAIPDDLIDDVALVGSKERIKDQLEKWKSIPITTLNIATFDIETLRTMAKLVM